MGGCGSSTNNLRHNTAQNNTMDGEETDGSAKPKQHVAISRVQETEASMSPFGKSMSAPESPSGSSGDLLAGTKKDKLLAKLISKWAEHLTLDASGKVTMDEEPRPIVPGPDLDEHDEDVLATHVEQCLEGKGGELSAISHAVRLGNTYDVLSLESKQKLFYLLKNKFGVDTNAIKAGCERILAVGETDDVERAKVMKELSTAMAPRYLRLFKLFNNGLFAGSSGVAFLVKLRSELITLLKQHPQLRELDTCLCDLLSAWFDLSFLELKHVTWDGSPASVMELLMKHEAVHKIQSWDDMRNRLQGDRRVYAYFHPKMYQVPLIFVEVALVNGIPNRIGDLLAQNRDNIDPKQADTAAFYSITNTQSGLAQISFGNFLIKKAAMLLRKELPNLKTFVTLSPVPGFCKWLLDNESAWPLSAEHIAMLDAAREGDSESRTDALRKLARRGEGRQILLMLAAFYFLKEKARGNKPRDPVSRFHLNNGASLHRIHVGADMSENGVKQSAGIMVNYLYRFEDVETNHESYCDGIVKASTEVMDLLAA